MTIISTKPQLMQFFSDTFLEKTARRCGFMERFRNIGPQSLVLSLIAALSKGNCTSIADLHRQFNGMCLSEKHTVAYKPFHNQLRKSTFADFMKTLVTFAMVQLIENVLPPLPKKFEQFDDILLQDGGSFNVHPDLAGVFPCRFSPLKAAVECHMTLSLFSQSPIAMTVTADMASERAYLPAPHTLRNKLLLADAGYVDFGYFEQLSLSSGSFIVRGSQSLNPLIVSARNGQGRQLPTLAAKNSGTSAAKITAMRYWISPVGVADSNFGSSGVGSRRKSASVFGSPTCRHPTLPQMTSWRSIAVAGRSNCCSRN